MKRCETDKIRNEERSASKRKEKKNRVRGTCTCVKAGHTGKKKLIATYGSVLLVFEVLSDGKDILPRAT